MLLMLLLLVDRTMPAGLRMGRIGSNLASANGEEAVIGERSEEDEEEEEEEEEDEGIFAAPLCTFQLPEEEEGEAECL